MVNIGKHDVSISVNTYRDGERILPWEDWFNITVYQRRNGSYFINREKGNKRRKIRMDVFMNDDKRSFRA